MGESWRLLTAQGRARARADSSERRKVEEQKQKKGKSEEKVIQKDTANNVQR